MAEAIATLTDKEQVLAAALDGIRERAEQIAAIYAQLPTEAIMDHGIIGLRLLQCQGIYARSDAMFWMLVRKHHDLPNAELETDGIAVYLAEEGQVMN